MLGTDLCEVLAPEHTVVACDVEQFDITDARRTLEGISEASPDTVVHTAAFTRVEACEEERDTALRINADGTLNVAEAARKVGARLVYVSTDYVFDGTKGAPYVETDPPNPINCYGETKLLGEQHVAEVVPHHLILRTSWLFGPHGRNFIDTITDRAAQGESLRVVDDQRGCPTYALHLARGIRRAIGLELEGLIHITNAGDATWYELARHALSLAGIDVAIEPVSTEAFGARAARPRYSVLASEVAGGLLEPLPPWEQAVRDHMIRKGVIKED
jgi:dTDP-4-dehydrorhamnose reductase